MNNGYQGADTNPIHIEHAVAANAAQATTTQNYTTTSCSCYVAGHAISANVYNDAEIVTPTAKIEVPSITVIGCNGASFTGFKITVLPTLGALSINGVAVTLNQMLSKTDFAQMVYTLGATRTNATDTFSYQVWASCANSGTLVCTLTIAPGYPDDTCGCITTTV